MATTGQKEGDYVEVKVLSNSTVQEFVGKKYWVSAEAEADDDTGYQLYTLPKSTKGTGMYVKIYSQAPARTVSFTVQDSNEDGISGATVTIGETTKTTGGAGGCTATLTDGDYEVEVSKEGYTTKTEEITVAYDAITFVITLASA